MSEFHSENYLQQLSAATSIDDCPKVPIPPIQQNQNYLFISYSHKDYKAVYADLAHLYDQNVRFWYDKGLHVGREWEQEVEEHIRHPNCCGIIFYISTNMFLSTSVLKEIEFTRKRKRGNIIYQKNYFCVNLHHGNISDILFDAQKIQKDKGLPLLDTKAVNTLTATFSDSATYISASSKFHLKTLIDQIQQQFDVTSQMDPSSDQSFFQTVDTPKAAMRALVRGKIAYIPLVKYVHSCYKENKTNRPWYLIPVVMAVGLIIMVLTWYRIFSMPDVPYMSYILGHYSPVMILSMGILFCGALWPYGVLALFWLYYLSPAYRKCERNAKVAFVNHLVYLCVSLVAAFLLPLAYITVLQLATIFVETAGKMGDYA